MIYRERIYTTGREYTRPLYMQKREKERMKEKDEELRRRGKKTERGWIERKNEIGEGMREKN